MNSLLYTPYGHVNKKRWVEKYQWDRNDKRKETNGHYFLVIFAQSISSYDMGTLYFKDAVVESESKMQSGKITTMSLPAFRYGNRHISLGELIMPVALMPEHKIKTM